MSASSYRRVLPTERDGLSRPSRSYNRSVCGCISYISATALIVYVRGFFFIYLLFNLKS